MKIKILMRNYILKVWLVIGSLLSASLFLNYSINPTFSAETIQIGFSQDTYVEEGAPSILPYPQSNLYLGTDTLAGKLRNRIFLHIPLTALTQNGILSKDIDTAKLYLFQHYYNSGNTYQIQWGSTKSSWDQYSLNWYTQPVIDVRGSTTFSYILGWNSIELNQFFKYQMDIGNSELSLEIKNDNESEVGGIFWSTDCYSIFATPRCEIWQIPYLELTIKENQPPIAPQLLVPAQSAFINTRNVILTWNESTDPDDLRVTYGLEISKDQSFPVGSDIGIDGDSKSYSFNAFDDGVYYWRVYAKDDRIKFQKRTYSEIGVFIIDTTPPVAPTIESEPPYSIGQENTVTWSYDRNSEPYGVNFKVANWEEIDSQISNYVEKDTVDLGYKYLELIETKYCFKVKAIDKVGNESSWSEITCTVQDFTSPIIQSLVLSEPYISPENSVGIKDSSKLSFTISEQNIEKWNLVIEDSQRNRVYLEEGNLSSFEMTIPNETLKPANGTYFVYLQVSDKVGQQGISNIERLVIDNVSPESPRIYAPANGQLTNNKILPMTIATAINTNSVVYLNGKEVINIADTLLQQNIPLDFVIEGENNLKAISTDFAGNFSESSIKFTIDTIAPTIPNFSITPDYEHESLILNVDSTDFAAINIYTKSGVIKQSKSASTLVLEKWSGDSDYYYAVDLIDLAGNHSGISSFATFHTPKREVLGVGATGDTDLAYPAITQTSVCKYKYNQNTNTLIKTGCSFVTPNLVKIENLTADKKKYILSAYSSYSPKITIITQNIVCKSKSYFEPLTWFGCVEMTVAPDKYEYVESSGDVWLKGQDIADTRHFSRSTKNDSSVTTKYLLDKDVSGQDAGVYSEVSLSIKGSGKYNWIDIFESSGISNNVKVENLIFNPYSDGSNKYFRFPFNNLIGVTQWHGYTAFDSPHTGIDFGSYLEPIYAVADGSIAAAGWDNYYGECLSGGNYVKILFDNGMSSFYAHLDNYRRSDGSNWTYGQRVTKGDLIGLTGNSGAYSCQPLGYHLHFELRNDLWQSSHVNPVPYIDVDWNQIRTLGVDWVPGRLSGDNPHPTY